MFFLINHARTPQQDRAGGLPREAAGERKKVVDAVVLHLIQWIMKIIRLSSGGMGTLV